MNIYIALLRGINVGGKNMIKMPELKKALEAIGLNAVQTYIQSGNVIFESDEEEATLQVIIENKIEAAFGFPVKVVLRMLAELEKMILDCPFSKDEISEAESLSDKECLYVALLSTVPQKDKTEYLNAYRSDSDDYRIIGRDVYLLFRNSISKSKLANNLQKLDETVTIRNWKTLNKLVLLAKEI
ncbi:DUF1697 domain-containing protein [Bacteroides sedimenti]|uniref:DUF1697 domain-containing protein n=1 Tax=Bacteroides sedimenti TaxID=2136147 RepID=A0ABN6Z319_9BACE